MEHVRAAGVSPTVARKLFERNGISWAAFTAEGVNVTDLRAVNDPFAEKIVNAAVAESLPMEDGTGEIRVFMRHVRSAQICSKGSREFFRKHDLDWGDFLSNGITVSKLEEIGDPIALRAAREAVEEEANGRR
jgi:hypothetical protein